MKNTEIIFSLLWLFCEDFICALDWYLNYNASFPDPVEMQKEIDLYMAQHDQEEERQNYLAKNAIESDENGWIAVSKRLVFLNHVFPSLNTSKMIVIIISMRKWLKTNLHT